MNGTSGHSKWEIRTVTGELVATHHRVEDPDGKRYYWERDGKIGLSGIRAANLPLYRSDQIPPKASLLIVTEGEKAADALMSLELGICAVATVCGAAATPSQDVLEEIAVGRSMLLWPDNDEVGIKHMERVANVLLGRPNPTPTSRLTWPEAPDKGDAADWAKTVEKLSIADRKKTLRKLPITPYTYRENGQRNPVRVQGRREGDLFARIRSALPVEMLAGQLTQLHGTVTLKGRCPFHGETRGEAFVVWPETGRWKCFGSCAKGGDVIDLIEAAQEAGLEWKQPYLGKSQK